jgi:hypothetical protein
MIDDAFLPFREIVSRMLAFDGVIADDEAGVRSEIVSCAIDSPVELDLSRDGAGNLQIGTTPPLYYVDTSIRPVFHRMRFTAVRNGGGDGH